MSSIMEQLGFPSADSAKVKLFDAMRQHGISHLEASYSGGNDEGGVDDVDVMQDAEGGSVEIEKMGWQHPIWEACDSVLSSEFGSWAGDFSANGTLYADLKENKVWRSGQQSSYEDDGATY